MARKTPKKEKYDEFTFSEKVKRRPQETQRYLVELPSGNTLTIEAANAGQLRGKLNQLKLLKKT